MPFIYNLIHAFLLLTLSQLVLSQLSDKSDIQKHLSVPENKDSLTYLAVFLLTTLHGASAFGGPGGDRTDFFQRVQASKATWAHPIKHFYAVVGKNDDNVQILTNPKYCTDLTKQYHHHVNHISAHPAEEVFECAGIRVLYLPYCDHKSWGPMGPCCRCEGAMRYYMNNYAAHPDYPSWFLFADDDYFVRTYKLWGILSKLNPHEPYSVVPEQNNNGGHVHAAGKDVIRKTDWAMWGGNHNCSVPCTHGSNWMALSIFSIGAMKEMEAEINKNGLIHVCELFTTTHDVGLGIFAWEHSIDSIPMCCGAGGMYDGNVENGVIWHEMGRTERGRDLANVMLDKIWKSGADKRGEKTPDLTKFIEYEYNEGVKHIHDNQDIPDGGFENSLYYRKVQLSEMLARQMHPDELKKLTNFPLRKTDYTMKECDKEMEFHYNWRKQHADKYPLNSDATIKGVTGDGNRYKEEYFYQAIVFSKNQIRMCAEYLEAVANAPVHLSDIPNLPNLDALTRAKY